MHDNHDGDNESAYWSPLSLNASLVELLEHLESTYIRAQYPVPDSPIVALRTAVQDKRNRVIQRTIRDLIRNTPKKIHSS